MPPLKPQDLVFMREVGVRLRRARQEIGYSVEELAALMKRTPERVRGWESGSIMIDLLELVLFSSVTTSSVDEGLQIRFPVKRPQ